MSNPEDSRPLTQRDIEPLVERAAERAIEKLYAEAGRGIISKIAYLLITASLGFAAAKGWLFPPSK